MPSRASGTVFVPVRHVEPVRQGDPSRERGVNLDRDPLAGVEVQRSSTGDVHADRQCTLCDVTQ
jgi:hypothetical protein